MLLGAFQSYLGTKPGGQGDGMARVPVKRSKKKLMTEAELTSGEVIPLRPFKIWIWYQNKQGTCAICNIRTYLIQYAMLELETVDQEQVYKIGWKQVDMAGKICWAGRVGSVGRDGRAGREKKGDLSQLS